MDPYTPDLRYDAACHFRDTEYGKVSRYDPRSWLLRKTRLSRDTANLLFSYPLDYPLTSGCFDSMVTEMVSLWELDGAYIPKDKIDLLQCLGSMPDDHVASLLPFKLSPDAACLGVSHYMRLVVCVTMLYEYPAAFGVDAADGIESTPRSYRQSIFEYIDLLLTVPLVIEEQLRLTPFGLPDFWVHWQGLTLSRVPAECRIDGWAVAQVFAHQTTYTTDNQTQGSAYEDRYPLLTIITKARPGKWQLKHAKSKTAKAINNKRNPGVIVPCLLEWWILFHLGAFRPAAGGLVCTDWRVRAALVSLWSRRNTSIVKASYTRVFLRHTILLTMVVRDFMFYLIRNHPAMRMWYARYVPAWKTYEESFQENVNAFLYMRSCHPDGRVPEKEYLQWEAATETYIKGLSDYQALVHVPGNFWTHLTTFFTGSGKGKNSGGGKGKGDDVIRRQAMCLFERMPEIMDEAPTAEESEHLKVSTIRDPYKPSALFVMRCMVILADLHAPESVNKLWRLALHFYPGTLHTTSMSTLIKTSDDAAQLVLRSVASAWTDFLNLLSVDLPYDIAVAQLDAMQSRTFPKAVPILPVAFDPETQEMISGTEELDFAIAVKDTKTVLGLLSAIKRKDTSTTTDAESTNRLWGSDPDAHANGGSEVDLSETLDEQAMAMFEPRSGSVYPCDLFAFCPSCTHITSMITEFSGKGSANAKSHESLRVTGFDDIKLAIESGKVYCGRKNGEKAKECRATEILSMRIWGRLIYFHGKAYMVCPQPGCGIIMEYDPVMSLWTKRGPSCCNCTARIFAEDMQILAMSVRPSVKVIKYSVRRDENKVFLRDTYLPLVLAMRNRVGEKKTSIRASKAAFRKRKELDLESKTGHSVSRSKGTSKKVKTHTRMGKIKGKVSKKSAKL